MSDNAPTDSVEKCCPVCDERMEAMDTICTACRAKLEKSTLAVRAQDYPPPARAMRGSEMPDRESGLGSPIEAQLDAAVNDDIDLLPLAPMGDFVRSATMSPSTRLATSQAMRTTTVMRPAPAPTPVEMDMPAMALRPQSRWKLAVIAIVISLLAGLLGAVIWSYILPARPEQPTDPADSISRPSTAR